MKHWKNILAAGAVVSVAGLAQTADAATYNYVGSWKLGDGPDWTVADALTGQEAAALLFGGTAADYVISTVSDLVADIDFMAWVDTYSQPAPFTATKVAQDYVNDGGDGKYNAFGETTAYVSD
ncbi:hypothetical protein HA397_30705, partial [Escherichia coli]|nr:hypothetical protein [Escherichia coli]